MGKRTDFGRHYIVDYLGCDPEAIKHVDSVRDVFLEAARDSRATLLETAFHQFSPFGVSGVVLIAESHFAIHTWPEDGFAGVDIFTCGEEMRADVAIEVIRKGIRAKEVRMKILVRGQLESS